MRYKLLILLLSCTLGLTAQTLSERAGISLITCNPGAELYARYGHTAIRVCDPEQNLDLVFNYGLFDFNSDHFYWRFIKGETYYMLGAQYTRQFMLDYALEDRAVTEQVLQITHEQKEAIWQALCINFEPENRTYLYNFVFDNCATRPYYLIKNALGADIVSDFRGAEGMTYRTFLSHYTGDFTWADFGINLLFGPKADQPMHGEQRLFLPEELMLYMAAATDAEGHKLVAGQTLHRFETPVVSWYADCRFGLSVYVLLLALLSMYDRRRGKLSWGVDLAVAIAYSVILAIVVFLTFWSIHPLVGFGWRLLIIPALHAVGRVIYFIPQKK